MMLVSEDCSWSGFMDHVLTNILMCLIKHLSDICVFNVKSVKNMLCCTLIEGAVCDHY